MKLQWRVSYETVKFDTSDGDLHEGQYAVSPKGGFYVRRHPQNNFQFLSVANLDPLFDVTEVHIVPGQMMFYNEFMLPDNRIYREISNEQAYRDLARENAGKPEKDVTDDDIKEIKKDDIKWEAVPINDEKAKKFLKKGGIQNGPSG